MMFKPTLITEEKIVEKPGYVPDLIITVRDTRMPLQQMGFYNSLRNTRNRYAKKRSPSYRDFSSELGGEN